MPSACARRHFIFFLWVVVNSRRDAPALVAYGFGRGAGRRHRGAMPTRRGRVAPVLGKGVRFWCHVGCEKQLGAHRPDPGQCAPNCSRQGKGRIAPRPEPLPARKRPSLGPLPESRRPSVSWRRVAVLSSLEPACPAQPPDPPILCPPVPAHRVAPSGGTRRATASIKLKEKPAVKPTGSGSTRRSGPAWRAARPRIRPG
jgi:hypothetical protein